jgi:hypothetical protein
MMFEFTTLALTFTCGVLASLAIHFLVQRMKLCKKRQTGPLLPKPASVGSDSLKIEPFTSPLFPAPANLYPINYSQGPPLPPFGQFPPPPFVPMPPNSGHIPMPVNGYDGESFGSHRRVHQRLNRTNMWQARRPEPPNNNVFAFTVYYRHRPARCVPAIEIMVEIHCEGLKKVLKNCLQNVDSIFDPTPLV